MSEWHFYFLFWIFKWVTLKPVDTFGAFCHTEKPEYKDNGSQICEKEAQP